MGSLGDLVGLLGLMETLQVGDEIRMLRNHLFQHLAEKHGYSAISIESNYPKGNADQQLKKYFQKTEPD